MKNWPALIGLDIGSGLVKSVMSVQAGLRSYVFPARVRAGFLGPDFSVETEGVYPFGDFSVTVGGFPSESGVPVSEVVKSVSSWQAKALYAGHVFSRFQASSPLRLALVGEDFSEADVKSISEVDEVIAPGFSMTMVSSVNAALADVGLDRYGRALLGADRFFSEPVIVIDGGRSAVRCWSVAPGREGDDGSSIELLGRAEGGIELEREAMRRSDLEGGSSAYGAVECLWLGKWFQKGGWRSCATLANAVMEIGQERLSSIVWDWLAERPGQTVVVVGGLAPTIRGAIGRTFGSSRRVIVPECPETALARGGAKLVRMDFQSDQGKRSSARDRSRDRKIKISVSRRVIGDELFDHLSTVEPLALGFEFARLASVGLKAEMERGVRVSRPDGNEQADGQSAAWRRIKWRDFSDRW